MDEGEGLTDFRINQGRSMDKLIQVGGISSGKSNIVSNDFVNFIVTISNHDLGGHYG